MSTAESKSLKNGLPFLERTETSAAVSAESIKPEIASVLRAAARELGIEVLVVESPPFAIKPLVHFSVWTRNPAKPLESTRAQCLITVIPTDYCVFPYQISLEVTSPRYPQKKLLEGVVVFRQAEATALLRSLMKSDKLPSFSRCRSKEQGWKFWLPKNRVKVLKPDYLATGLTLGMLVGFFGMLATLLAWPFVLLAVGSFIGVLVMPKTLQTLSAGRPPEDPLVLLGQDEWQAAVRGLGPDLELFQASLEADLRSSLPEGATLRPYPETYIGEDGVIFKNRVLVRHRRAVVFIDVESYKEELYVGWESKLNLGVWTEVLMGAGINLETGERCKVFTVRGAQGTAMRQDMQDTIFLGEFIQSKIRYWLRHYLDLRKIEERIDFEIVRGGREAIPGVQEKQKNPLKKLLRID
jgi:hypothetical protein